MHLNYAHPSTMLVRSGLPVINATVAAGCGILTSWCVIHAVRVLHAAQQGPRVFLCAEAAREWQARLGLPLDQTFVLALVGGGCAVAAFVQSIRCVNAARPR